MQKRSFLEVNTYKGDSSYLPSDPIKIFVHSLRVKHGGSDVIEAQNAQLLDKLIYNNYISKASIVWTEDNNNINRIYGLNINSDGAIRYDNQKLSSPEKKKLPVYIPATSNLDLSAIQHSLCQS